MAGKQIVILCTVPTQNIATSIARALVEKKIAACCNILPSITSVYEWQGKVETDDELLLIIKSTEENYKLIESEIIALHPYEVPEIIVLEISKGSQKYLSWITEVTKASNG